MVTGDFPKLDGLIRELSYYDELIAGGMADIAEEARRLIVMDGFEREEDPYGDAWAETKQENPILQKTGRLRSSFLPKPRRRGIEVNTSVEYAEYYQQNSRAGSVVVRRMMVPEANDLPEKWATSFERVLQNYLDRRLKPEG